MNVGLLRTSLVNFPGRVCAAVFLPGCNLRCPFCHNGELACASVVSGPKNADAEAPAYVTLDEVFTHLEKRRNVIGGLAISGGEPLLSSALKSLIDKARGLSLAVKIDTNGTLPDRLQAILGDPLLRPDMIAVDVKTVPARYGELATESEAGARCGNELLRTLELLEREQSECAATGGGAVSGNIGSPRALRVEYRTVLVPGLVGEREIRELASLLPVSADWQFAPFVPGTCLDLSWNEVEPYGPVETKRLVDVAKSLRAGATLR
jgi:pyruvate formate lyase activating enzyme